MTADRAGWPDPARPGYPLHPERDGWHWLHHKEDLRPIPAMWNAALAGWTCGTLHSPGGIVDLGYTYLGPCILPSALAEREKEAYRRGWLDRESDFMAGVERTGMAVTDESALAERDERMREEGRREAFEEAARIADKERGDFAGMLQPETAYGAMCVRNAIRARSEGKG